MEDNKLNDKKKFMKPCIILGVLVLALIISYIVFIILWSIVADAFNRGARPMPMLLIELEMYTWLVLLAGAIVCICLAIKIKVKEAKMKRIKKIYICILFCYIVLAGAMPFINGLIYKSLTH